MLLDQDFRRRHEGDLVSGFDRLQCRERRDDGLAAAHIALQQPLHRLAAGEVAADFRDHARLRLGQRERQALVEDARQRAVAAQARRLAPGARAPMHLQRELLREQFVELEPRPRRMRALVERSLRRIGRRFVQVAHGLREAPQSPRLARPRRQRFAEQRGIARQRAVHELAQRVLRESRRRRIHRRQALGQRRARRDDVKGGMHHLQSEVPVAHFAERAHALARGKRLLLTGIEVKEAQHQLCVAVLQQADELPPAPILNLGVGDGSLDLPRLPGRERRQRTQMRMVFVAQRQMQHEVLLAHDADARELVLERVAGLGFRRRRLLRRHARSTGPCCRRRASGRPAWSARSRVATAARLRSRRARPWAAPRPDTSPAPDTAA